MMNTVKLNRKLISSIILAAIVSLFVALPAQQVFAVDASDAVCESLGATGAECSEGGSGIDTVLRVALNLLSFIAGVIAVIMLMIAGIKYLTSQGDSGSVSGARNTIIYALVGIIIVVLSQSIIQFVLRRATVPPVLPVDGSSLVQPIV
jgi:hypothetical protein